jgi:diacylglycerol kinase
MSRFFRSFLYALAGIKYSFITQGNFKFHTFAAVFTVVAGFYFNLKAFEWLWIVAAIAMVVGVELVNTAIETLVDLVSPEYNFKAGVVKDVSAAAVLVISIMAAIIGAIIFWPKLF